MMKDMAPCKGCTDRYEACHGKCEKYKAWKKKHDEIRRRVYLERYPDYWVNAYLLKDEEEDES